ncbi:MAG: hypothetical protein PF447_01460 [Spirochaetaceae bacterium]|jgi:hypothetical protein|nr:hypothetical protein [Spirochaetaceae bacterium]
MNEKMFLIFSLFILISVGTFSQDQQNFVKYTIIYENFDIRRISSPADPTGPNAIAFDNDGNLFITNPLGRQIFKFNNTFGYEETLSLERDMFGLNNADSIYYRNGNVWGNSGNHISLINKSENRKYQIDIVNLQSKYILRQNAFYLTENYFFHYLEDGGIICIPHPGMNSNENLSKVLKNEEVRALFEPGSGYDMDGLTMDDKYRLFRDGKLVNRDYYNWMDYWMDQYGYDDPREFNLDTRHKDIPLWRNGYNQAYYMGDDANGNSYWRSLSDYIYVFNDNGWCIKEIKYNDFYHLPTVHPNGDIYFMKWGEEQNSVELYKIPNT